MAFKGLLTKTTPYFTLNRDDCDFPIIVRVPSTDVVTYRKVFIYQEYKINLKVKPRVIIDAGANIGLASIYFANKYPDATIIAIEPERENFELLLKNTNFYPNIKPLQAALWNENTELNVVDVGEGNWGFVTERDQPSDTTNTQACHTIPAITVDKIIDDFNLPAIDILKIDIEGSEKEVFVEPSRWIEKVQTIIIELHDRIKPGCSRSFYCGTNGFSSEWNQGENVFLTRHKEV